MTCYSCGPIRLRGDPPVLLAALSPVGVSHRSLLEHAVLLVELHDLAALLAQLLLEQLLVFDRVLLGLPALAPLQVGLIFIARVTRSFPSAPGDLASSGIAPPRVRTVLSRPVHAAVVNRWPLARNQLNSRSKANAMINTRHRTRLAISEAAAVDEPRRQNRPEYPWSLGRRLGRVWKGRRHGRNVFG